MHTTTATRSALADRPAFRIVIGDELFLGGRRVRVTHVGMVVRYGTRTRPLLDSERTGVRLLVRGVANARYTDEVTLGQFDTVRRYT